MIAETTFKLRFGLRELFYVSLCIVLGYLLRVQDSYSLYPVWRKRSEVSKFANGKFMTDVDRCPLPIITDLEGDGVNEIVLISNDLEHLNVLAMPSANEDQGKTLAHVIVKNKVKLSPVDKVKGHTSRPYVVGVGFTEPYLSMMQIRKQVIVVVTDDWQVLCYAHDLKLLWHQQLPLPVSDLSAVEVKALAVLVSPFSIEKKHKGLVVISGNFKHKTHKPDLLAEFKKIEEPSRNRTLMFHSEHENETLTHFSTFALSVEDGSFLWKHTAGDFERPQQQDHAGNKSDHIHWKLGLRHKRAHKGESPWTDYGKQLDKFLPHMWADNSDTEIVTARISKQFDTILSEAHEPQEAATAQNPSALLPEHLIGFSYGGQRPHSDHEHVRNPNSLVIRSPEGMQVLSLVTGEPKATLMFPPDRSLYLDMDNDGYLEKLVWDLGLHYSPCYLDVWRINPVQERLQQIALCYSKRLFWTRSWSLEEDVYKKISPKVIKSLARKSGVLRHFLGHNLFEENTYDIITFGGLGRVSSIGIDGTIHWQTLTDARWADLSMNMRRSGGRPVPDDIKEEFLLSFQPSRLIMPLKEAGPKAAVVVSGWNTLAVVDLVEGTLLAQHSIPAPSAGPLVYGDFDNDGLVDIILTCKKGYIGFSMKLQHNYELTAVYTVTVFLLIILFSWFISASSQSDNGSEKEEEDDDDEEDEMSDERFQMN